MRMPARALWPGAAVAVLLVLAALGIPRLHTVRQPATAVGPVLTSGTAFAVPLREGRAVISLPDGDGRAWLLILSSLGDASQHEQIRLTAIPAAALNGRDQQSSSSRLEPVLPLSRPPQAAPFADSPRESPVVWNRPASALADAATDDLQPASRRQPPAVRTFRLHVTDGDPGDARQYTAVEGRLAGFGQQIQVYADAQLQPGELAAGLVEEIVQLFDRSVCPQVCGLLGSWNDVDDDGRFTVLLSPWLGRLQGGKTSVGGFVRQADFTRTTNSPLSNRCDMLYLNSSLRPGRHLETLLLHEFTHAVCFSQRGAGSMGGTQLPREEDWLNEAIAHAVETRFGGWSNLDYRISRYLNEPAHYPLIVPDYYTAGLWRNHGCRGATSLFLQWLQQRYGEQILRQLVREPASGITSLERVTGVRFSALYRQFTLALASAEPGSSAGAGIELGEALQSPVSPGLLRAGNLQGVLNGWGLAGPRRTRWNPSEKRQLRVGLTGTSTAWIEIQGPPPSPGGHRNSAETERGWQLVLEGRAGSRLQATLVPLERHSEQFELLAACQGESGPMDSLPTRQPHLARISRTARQPDLRAATRRQTAPVSGVVTAGYSSRFRVPAHPASGARAGISAADRLAAYCEIRVRIGPAGSRTAETAHAAEEAVQRTPDFAATPEVLLLACEWHQGETRQNVCLTGDELAAARVDPPAAAGSQPGRSEYRLLFPRPDRQGQTAGRTLTLKAIVRDSEGNRHVLWSSVPEEPQDEFNGSHSQEMVSEPAPTRR